MEDDDVRDAFFAVLEDSPYSLEVLANDEEQEDFTTEGHGCEGITIVKKFPASIVKATKRTHVNLGHPTEAEMLRILRRSGASEEAILAAKG